MTTLSRYKICTWLKNQPFLRKARGQIDAIDISEFLGAFLVFTFGAFDFVVNLLVNPARPTRLAARALRLWFNSRAAAGYSGRVRVGPGRRGPVGDSASSTPAWGGQGQGGEGRGPGMGGSSALSRGVGVNFAPASRRHLKLHGRVTARLAELIQRVVGNVHM
jgi:hypothetical protein